MKVGIDLIENERINQISNAQKKIFLEEELQYINKFANKTEHFCAIFCAKEAVFKCLNLPKINFLEIQILHNENSRPYVQFKGKTLNYFNENFKTIDLSISHSKSYSTAIAIAQEKEKITLL